MLVHILDGSSDIGGLTTGFVYCLGALVLAGLSVINPWACNDLWTASEALFLLHVCGQFVYVLCSIIS